MANSSNMPDWLLDQMLATIPLCPVELELHTGTPAQMAYWMNHAGDLLGPGPVDNPTGWEKYANLTHRIMKPQRGQVIQAISWCGRRVHEVPGRGPVDCRECLEAIACGEVEAITAALTGDGNHA